MVTSTLLWVTGRRMESRLQRRTNKKKKTKHVAAESSANTSTTTETPKLSSVASSRPTTAQKTQAHVPVAQPHRPVESHPVKPVVDSATLASSAKGFEQLGSDEKLQELESLIHQLDIKSARIHKNLDNVYSEQSSAISAIQSVLNARERQLVAHLEGARREVDSKIQQQRSQLQKLKQNPKSADEFARVKAEQGGLDSWLEASLFNVHADKAIKVIEKLGSGFLPASTEAVTSHPLPTTQHANRTNHQAPPKAQQPTIAQPNGQQNGKPINKALNGANIKHSISHSSLGSEENDSGLGQISPVSQEKSVVAQVADGGFLFASDGLDVDQLAKIKAQVAETLKAQGIDPAILAGIASGDSSGFTTAAPRRRNNQGRKDQPKPPPSKENKKPAAKSVKS